MEVLFAGIHRSSQFKFFYTHRKFLYLLYIEPQERRHTNMSLREEPRYFIYTYHMNHKNKKEAERRRKDNIKNYNKRKKGG
jgi:hypothetical protein